MIIVDVEYISEFTDNKLKYFKCNVTGDSLSDLLSNVRSLKSQIHNFYDGRQDYTGRTSIKLSRSELV